MIRPAGVADLQALYELEVLCFRERRFPREYLGHLLNNPSGSTFVQEEGRVVGSVMLLKDAGCVRVLSLAVHPDHRRRGIGRGLMAVAEDVARRSASREVRLEVSTNNAGAIAFYDTLGYGIRQRLSEYYAWGDDAFVMAKPIAAPLRKT